MNETEKLALDILKLSRNLLLIKLRFLEPAFLQLTLLPDPEGSFATDGFFLYYNFYHVLKRYQIQQEMVSFDYLHMVLHCLFHHPFIGPGTDKIVWDTASDIAVGAAILELKLPYVETVRRERQQEMIEALKKDVPVLTAERLYHFFKEIDCEPERLLTIRDLFYSDDHELWYRHSAVSQPDEEPQAADAESEDGEDEQAAGEPDAGGDESGEKKSANQGGNSAPGTKEAEEPNDASPGDEDGEALWRDISSKVQTDLETLSRDTGEKAGSLLRNLKEVNRERYDYGEFLRTFSILGEVLKTSDEEFDYVYYTYGLSLYGDMPLVEPLEYSEQHRIQDLAIVIDTSASVDGDLVQTFVRKTYNILKSTESFFHRINLHLIQCDAAVQEDTKITAPEELETFLAGMKLKGFGGTDFRPAFAYIDSLVEQREFSCLTGVIYFTDGEGVYPEKQPDYETAFVFIENEYEDKDVPPWAVKLILEKEDLL